MGAENTSHFGADDLQLDAHSLTRVSASAHGLVISRRPNEPLTSVESRPAAPSLGEWEGREAGHTVIKGVIRSHATRRVGS